MGDVVTYPEVGEWLQSRYPSSVIRAWSDGDIELLMNRTDMDEDEYALSEADLPGDWCIEKTVWGPYGVSMTLTRAINLDRGGDDE